MLIETPYKANDTVTLKLVTGEEVVAKLVEESATSITVYKPMVIMATATGLGMGPFAFTTSPTAKVEIRQSAVVAVVKTDSAMAKQYVTSTTGVVI